MSQISVPVPDDQTVLEDALSSAARAVSGNAGDALFRELARGLATILRVDAALIAALQETAPPRMRSVAFFLDGTIRDPFDYELPGTPCERVIQAGWQFHSAGVSAQFVTDVQLKQLGLDAYSGLALIDSNGRKLGVIAALSRTPLERPAFVQAVLRIFAVRAAAELERIKSDAAATASYRSYREIFEASPDAIFVHDRATGAIVDVNPTACKVYGYTREEMLRLSVGDLSSQVPPYTAEHIARAIRDGSARFEWHRRNKDGSLHWDEVHLRSAQIGGQPRVLAFTREITERKLSRERLQKSEDRLRATLHAALDCIIVMDERGEIIEFNPAAERCFGYSRNQAVGARLADLIIPPRQRDAHIRGLRRFLETGEGAFLGRRLEVIAQRADGTEFPVELAISVAQGPDGHVFIGYLRDITEHKEAERRRERLEVQLRQAQKMEALGKLTGGIAHDFNNLLASILGYIVLAIERQASLGDARLAGYLERAHLGCERARELIKQMLMFSRGQRGTPRPVSLPPIIERVLTVLRPSFPETVSVRLQLDPDAPAALLDPVQLEQVLMNLCVNARDAIKGGGTLTLGLNETRVSGALCAACRQTVSGEYVQVTVGDDGPGMSEEVLEHIFEPFFSTKETGRGTGMGLATVHGIVHEHGGHLLVESAPGQGATFRVLFPKLRAESRPAQADAPTPLAEFAARRSFSGSVLVVDDEEAVGEYMRELLETWGMQSAYTPGPQQALEQVRQEPSRFDLIITDQAMPGMTGLELARALRAVRADLPVVLYSALGEGIEAAQLQAAGIRTLLAKPVDPVALEQALRLHLTRSVGAASAD